MGERYAAADPLELGKTGLLLDLADLEGDGRGGEVKFFGDAGEGQGLGGGAKDFQLTNGDMGHLIGKLFLFIIDSLFCFSL